VIAEKGIGTEKTEAQGTKGWIVRAGSSVRHAKENDSREKGHEGLGRRGVKIQNRRRRQANLSFLSRAEKKRQTPERMEKKKKNARAENVQRKMPQERAERKRLFKRKQTRKRSQGEKGRGLLE